MARYKFYIVLYCIVINTKNTSETEDYRNKVMSDVATECTDVYGWRLTQMITDRVCHHVTISSYRTHSSSLSTSDFITWQLHRQHACRLCHVAVLLAVHISDVTKFEFEFNNVRTSKVFSRFEIWRMF